MTTPKWERELMDNFLQHERWRQQSPAFTKIDEQAHQGYIKDVVEMERRSGIPLSYGQALDYRKRWNDWAEGVKRDWRPLKPMRIKEPPGVHTPDEYKLEQLKAERDAHKAKLGPLAAELERQLRGGTAWSATVKGLKFNADLGKLNTDIAYEEGMIAGCIRKGTVAIVPPKAVFTGFSGVYGLDLPLHPLAGHVQATIRIGRDLLFPLYVVRG